MVRTMRKEDMVRISLTTAFDGLLDLWYDCNLVFISVNMEFV